MASDSYYIAQLIYAYLRDTLTQEEEEVLFRWIAENDKNRQTFELLTDENRSQESLNFLESLDVEAAWQKVQANRKPAIGGTAIVKRTKYVAAVIAFAMLVGAWFVWSGPFDSETALTAQYQLLENDALPGRQRAILHLSDGRSIDLESEQLGVNEQDGTTIRNAQGALTYVGNGGSGAELLYNMVEVPKAGTYYLELADGTRVWMNAMSELKFPVQFGDNQRKVFLKGEAYFEVARHPTTPFIVDVDGKSIEVLGTHFNVNAYGEDVSTTLLEGAVRVSNDTEERVLSPGEMASVGKQITVKQADLKKAIAWKDGEFYFKSDHIGEIMGQVARWYDVGLVFKGAYPAKKGYSGSISRDVNMSQVLEMISYVSGAKFVVEDNKVVIEF